MSAYVIEDDKMNKIVSFHVNDRFYTGKEKDMIEIAKTLMDENVKSVNYRYKENSSISSQENSYKFKREFNPISSISTLRLLNELEYQSCEHPDYKTSKAYYMLNNMRRSATYRIEGYNKI